MQHVLLILKSEPSQVPDAISLGEPPRGISRLVLQHLSPFLKAYGYFIGHWHGLGHLDIFWTCSFQFRCSSRVTPKYFTDVCLFIWLLPKCRTLAIWFNLDFADLNRIKHDLFVLRVRLFALNQLFKSFLMILSF